LIPPDPSRTREPRATFFATLEKKGVNFLGERRANLMTQIDPTRCQSRSWFVGTRAALVFGVIGYRGTP